jgi:hypothetical protein
MPFAVVAITAAPADVSSCETSCIYAETAPGRSQGAATAAVCFPLVEALRSLFRCSFVAVLFPFFPFGMTAFIGELGGRRGPSGLSCGCFPLRMFCGLPLIFMGLGGVDDTGMGASTAVF